MRNKTFCSVYPSSKVFLTMALRLGSKSRLGQHQKRALCFEPTKEEHYINELHISHRMEEVVVVFVPALTANTTCFT